MSSLEVEGLALNPVPPARLPHPGGLALTYPPNSSQQGLDGSAQPWATIANTNRRAEEQRTVLTGSLIRSRCLYKDCIEGGSQHSNWKVLNTGLPRGCSIIFGILTTFTRHSTTTVLVCDITEVFPQTFYSLYDITEFLSRHSSLLMTSQVFRRYSTLMTSQVFPRYSTLMTSQRFYLWHCRSPRYSSVFMTSEVFPRESTLFKSHKVFSRYLIFMTSQRWGLQEIIVYLWHHRFLPDILVSLWLHPRHSR